MTARLCASDPEPELARVQPLLHDENNFKLRTRAQPRGSGVKRMQQTQRGVTSAYVIVTSLFFAWGFITSLIDPLVASVKGIFSLTDVEAQLSASAFFIAYGVMSFPAAVLLARRKAVPTILIALVMMIAGCMLMLLAASIAEYMIVLLGLFVLASGITIL